MSFCVKCGENVPEELKITFSQCAHHIHADCLSSDPNKSWSKCGLCLGHYEPIIVAEKVGPKRGKPRLMDGVDWCINPGTRNTGSKLATVASYVPMYGKRFEETSENSTNPFFLLKLGKEIPDIMTENQLDLPHFCKVGVTMRDFLENGYSWEDLKHFKDISGKGSKRTLQVIAKGLHTDANDFRDYPEALPFKQVKAETKFKNGDICRLFGLTFPERGSHPGDPVEGGFLQCKGDKNWKAQDCIDLELKMGELSDFGLNYVHQYIELMTGLSQTEANHIDGLLKVSDEMVRDLIDLEAEAEEMEQQRRASLQAEHDRRIQMKARVIPQKEESESESEEPPYFNPNPVIMPEKESPPISLYEIRSKQRARFHGLKKKTK